MKNSTLTLLLVSVMMVNAACNNQANEQAMETESKIDSTTQEATALPGKEPVPSNLELKNISFDIQTKGNGSIKKLNVQSHGLENDQKFEMDLEGELTDSLVTDLNADEFPELVLFTRSAGSGSYGNVIAFSVNNGKSMSRVYFPPVSENPKLKEGYMGHDRFFIQDSKLMQEFPIYKKTDPNSDPTGGVRRIEYKLVDGEASRKFVSEKISDSATK